MKKIIVFFLALCLSYCTACAENSSIIYNPNGSYIESTDKGYTQYNADGSESGTYYDNITNTMTTWTKDASGNTTSTTLCDSYGKVTGPSAVLYTEVNTTSDSIVILRNGIQMKIDKHVEYNTEVWYHVEAYQDGYSYSGYVRCDLVTEISYSDFMANSNNISESDDEIQGIIQVTSSDVAVREGPSTSDKIVRRAQYRDIYTYIDIENGWYKLWDGTYINDSYVSTNINLSDQSDDMTSYRYNDTGAMVTTIQEYLKQLGYYNGDVTGHYGTKTVEAVQDFQSDNRLTADGIADQETIAALQSKIAGSGVSISVSGFVYNINWFSMKGISGAFDSLGLIAGKYGFLTDLTTGIRLRIKIQATGNHADAEPATASDTEKFCSIYGVTNAADIASNIHYGRRPMLLETDKGYKAVCSMYGVPHGESTISDNDYPGAFCLHFLNSKTSGTDKVDAGHQTAITKAIALVQSNGATVHTLNTFTVNSLVLPIDEEHFPDDAFREYVSDEFDKDQNNGLSESEISAVTSIWVYGKNISNLQGIDYFSNLKDLGCGSNLLTNLDVSNNTQLTSLYCYGNKLTNLDVSNNTQLNHLSCSDNNLTNLDVSNNTLLKSMNCEYNNLTNLDVSNNTQLNHLSCSDNNLTNLDVSNNTLLKSINCGYNNLTNLDVSNNTQLTSLSCYSNNLTNLDVSNNTQLNHLSCSDNNLTNLDVSKNMQLTTLYCNNNNLTSLDVTYNASLTWLSCDCNQLRGLNISNNSKVRSLSCKNNSFSVDFINGQYALENFPVSFDPNNVIMWYGAQVIEGFLTLQNSGTISYDYDCGNGHTATFFIRAEVEKLNPPSLTVPSSVHYNQEFDIVINPDGNGEETIVELHKMTNEEDVKVNEWNCLSTRVIRFNRWNRWDSQYYNDYLLEANQKYLINAYSYTNNRTVQSAVVSYPLDVTGEHIQSPTLTIDNPGILRNEKLKVIVESDTPIEDVCFDIKSDDEDFGLYWLQDAVFSETSVTGYISAQYLSFKEGTNEYQICASAKSNGIWSDSSEFQPFTVTSLGKIPDPVISIASTHITGVNLTGRLTNILPDATYEVKVGNVACEVNNRGYFTIPGYVFAEGNNYYLNIYASCNGYQNYYAYGAATISVVGSGLDAPIVVPSEYEVNLDDTVSLTIYAPGASKLLVKSSSTIGDSADLASTYTEYITDGDITQIQMDAPHGVVYGLTSGQWKLSVCSLDGNVWSMWSEETVISVEAAGRLGAMSFSVPKYVYSGYEIPVSFSGSSADQYEISIFTCQDEEELWEANTLRTIVVLTDPTTYRIGADMLPQKGWVHIEVVAKKKGYIPSVGYDDVYIVPNTNTSPPPDLILPESLTVIESGAFYGIKAKVIRIPSTVTTIAYDAIPKNITVMVSKDAPIAQWLKDNGYKVVEE